MAADQRGWLPAIGALISAGCILPVLPVTSGRTLDKESMTAIVPGEATTSVLLKQLGPPLAIAARGQYVSVPAASAVRSGGASCNVESGGFFNIQSDGWFEPFSARRPIRDEHRVYYWYGSRTSGFNAYLLVGFANRCTTTTDELLVLVDTRTDRVEDVFFHEGD